MKKEKKMKLIYFYLIVTPFSKKLQRITLSSVLNTGSQLQDALMLLLFFCLKIATIFWRKKKIMTLKRKPIRHQLQSVTWQESQDFDKLKFGYTVLVWENMRKVWKFKNIWSLR